MGKILKYVIYDVLRSKMIIAYTLLLLLLSTGLFLFGSDDNKTISSILQIVLLIVPLVSIIFSTIHYYNSREFIELLLAQPITRRKIIVGEYFGVSSALALSFIIGVALPILLRTNDAAGWFLIVSGILLTFIFSALAFLASIKSNDKAKGFGLSLVLWFYFTVLYDGIVLFILYYFTDYPLEKPVLLLTALNPIDLARVMILLKLDISALMGYTGALYHKFFGSSLGVIFSLSLMLLWLAAPLYFSIRVFQRKDM